MDPGANLPSRLVNRNNLEPTSRKQVFLGYTVNSPRVSFLVGNALKFMTQVLITESLKVELLNWVMKLV
jgi:hypothetical protein